MSDGRMSDGKPKGLFKTTVVIWSDYDGTALELEDLARAATVGDAYCSQFKSEHVADPASDPAWDGCDFFEDDPIGDEQ